MATVTAEQVETRVVEIASVDTGRDLHRGKMQRGHHALQLLHREVRRLERQSPRSEKAPRMPRDDVGDHVVLHPVPLRGRLGGRPVAEGGRGGREELGRHFRAVHVLDAARGIEGVRSEVPVEGRAEVELAPRGGIALQPGPAVAPEAGGEVGPAGGEDVRVNVDRVDGGAPSREYSKLDSPGRAD